MTQPNPQQMDSANSEGSQSGDARARRLSGLRPFQPGQSGNPSGRPDVAKPVRDRFRWYISDEGGYEKLIALANGNTRDARAALELVFAHALGKPTQPLSGADAGESHDPLEIIHFPSASRGIT